MALRTGAEYRAALRDGRNVWQAGRLIEDVTVAPGLTGTIDTLARLYDEQHAPEHAATMTVDAGSERISYSYLPPATLEELRAKRRNIEHWSERTFGLMGRFPEFCAEMVVGLLDFARVLERKDRRWAENARAYYRHCTANDLCLTHALTDQYYDRTKRASDQDDPDLILRIVDETTEGPVVRGLRTLATMAPLADEVLVYPNRPRENDEADYAIAFAIPMNAPGLKIVCRDFYGEHADMERHPFSSRFDEVDAALIFDDVVVPWERVFAYRDPQLVFAVHGGTRPWATYSTMVRLVVRLESFLGVVQLLGRWTKRDKAPQSQELLSHFIQDIQVLRACLLAAEEQAVRTESGYLQPVVAGGYRLYSIEASDRAAVTMQQLLTSSLVVTGDASDLASAGIGHLIERYYRGGAPSTIEHLRLLAMANDLVMSHFAMRSQLYERLQSGEPERMRRSLTAGFNETRAVERIERFLVEMERCRETGPVVS